MPRAQARSCVALAVVIPSPPMAPPPPSSFDRAAFLPAPSTVHGLASSRPLSRRPSAAPVPSPAAAGFLRLCPTTRQHAHRRPTTDPLHGEGSSSRSRSSSSSSSNDKSHPSSARAEPTSPPRPSTGGGAWKLLMYALIALPNLWWAPAPFLPPAPPSSPENAAAAVATATRAAPATAFLERVGLSAPGAAAAAGLSDEQQLVADVWKRVDKLYLDRTFNGQDWFALRQTAMKKKYKTTQEVYDSIKAMLEPLADPYTRFLPPAQYDSLYGLATGSVAGVGVSLFIDPASNELTVAEVEKGSPAEAAGLASGDTLVSVDGTPTKGLLVDDCAAILRGPAGTKVGVVARASAKNGGASKDLIITRQVIKIQSVEASVQRLKGKPVGVIRLRSFSQTTAETVGQELDKLEKQGIAALVLDLRGNPGGFLGGGIDTARLFLPAYEKIVSVVGKTGIVEDYQTTDEGRETQKPLFILVDKRTASASEVLSAALKENGRAKLVGEKTFGKGVVQTIEQVGQGCGVSVTIAAYSTPLGNNINKKGIEVDVPSQCEPSDAAVACLPESLL